jgi:hypothetical protein
MADAMCAWARSCCEVDDIVALLSLPSHDAYSLQLARDALSSHDSCRDVMHGMCENQFRLPLDALLAESVELDREAFQTCQDIFRAAATSCDIGRAGAPALTQTCAPEVLFTGRQEAGETCNSEVECNDETTCWDNFGNSSVPGICVAQAESESACQSNNMCGANQTCRTSRPAREWCVVSKKQAENQWCFDDAHCGAGLYCDVRQEVCVQRGGEGAECFADYHCRSLRCLEDTNVCAGVLTMGDQCDNHSDCGDEAWCDPAFGASTCSAPLTAGAAGDDCTPPGELTCQQGLRCVDQVCRTPLENGTSCRASEECYENSHCHSSTRVCTVRLTEGASCTTNQQCEAPLFCDSLNRLCVSRLSQGESCSAGRGQCTAGFRCHPTTETCEPGLSTGERCGDITDCAAGLLCRSFTGRCEEQVSRDGACNDHGACQETDFCDTRASVSTCTPATEVYVGESCSGSSVVCAGGLYCYSGTCHAEGNAGESCSTYQPCAAGLVCYNDNCQQPGGSGAVCSLNEHCQADYVCGTYNSCTSASAAGGSCNRDDQCEPGTYCSYPSCRTYVLVDGSCNSTTAQCNAGLYCDSTRGNLCTTVSTLGQTCSDTIPCADGLWCNNEMCVAAPTVGDACGQEGQPDCEAGSYCDTVTNVCAAYGGRGDDCTPDSPCQSGLYCRSYHGTCTARPAAFEECDSRTVCRLGHECVPQQTCEALAAEGESCDDSDDCAEGLYCQADWSICLALNAELAPGATCRVNEECRSGSCVDHVCVAACIGGLRPSL